MGCRLLILFICCQQYLNQICIACIYCSNFTYHFPVIFWHFQNICEWSTIHSLHTLLQHIWHQLTELYDNVYCIEIPVDQSLCLFQETTICCHLLYAFKGITLLSLQVWSVYFFVMWIEGIAYCIDTHSHTHRHAHSTVVHRKVLGCSFDAPPAKWSCCFLAPVTMEMADCIISARQRGTARWKREPIFSILSSAFFQWWPSPLFFCPPYPPPSPLTPPFISPSTPSPFIKKL